MGCTLIKQCESYLKILKRFLLLVVLRAETGVRP
jgi:hypothetical protein